MLPVDELPGSGADRSLAEVRRDAGRYDGRDWHREQLREDRQRLGERHNERAVVRRREAGDGFRCTGGVVLGALDGVQGLTAAPFDRRIEHALPALHDVARDEGCAVMKGDAATEVKGVDQPIPRDVPPLSERGLHFRAWVEAGEAIEEVADGSARGNIGRKRGIERARIVCVARVDERAP